MDMRFCINPETNEPHIFDHGVTEDEIRQVLVRRGDDFRGRRSARIRFGQTLSGRYLKVVYVPDEERDSVFVITAYDLKGKALKGFRRRQRRKPR
ncbi:MAG TPA: hypothetical protein VG013_14110 [Gemmataceae bacterium]|jgi:hypothetical protein|nr:hypothetical protein [Gemmataceae bacterium]